MFVGTQTMIAMQDKKSRRMGRELTQRQAVFIRVLLFGCPIRETVGSDKLISIEIWHRMSW
jgi:hypothetical protein